MKCFTSVLLASLALTSTGCATFKASERATAKDQLASGALFGQGKQARAIYAGSAAEAVFSGQSTSTVSRELNAFKENCEASEKSQKQLIGPILVPVVAAIPKMIMDISADKTERELKALKQSASSSYSVDFVLPKGIAGYRCLAVMRHDSSGRVTAASTYNIIQNGPLVYLNPVFMFAANTVANTREVEDGEKEQIDIIAAFSVQGIGKQKSGIPVIEASGSDSKKVGTVALSKDDIVKVSPGDLVIGPVPAIPDSGFSLLRVAVTEVGDIGFDVDQRIVAQKTLKEALGSALEAGITTDMAGD